MSHNLRRTAIKASIESSLDYLLDDNFRVSIFGSARIPINSFIYNETHALAALLAKANIDVITGGGGGVMEAANKGHNSAAGTNKVHSIGLGIELPHEQKFNNYIGVQRRFRKFSRRLDQFMLLSNAVIIMDGGIGTCLEFFYTWQLTQVQHIHSIPIILLGKQWPALINWVKDSLVQEGYLDETDLDNIFIAQNNSDAMHIVLATRKQVTQNQ
jgi:uncharacterized protein (TIGR00730 family)